MDLDKLLGELDAALESRVRSQRERLFEVAHRIDPKLTWDDVVNPDTPELRGSESFNYEDGTLAGLLSAQIVVRSRLRELMAAGSPPSLDEHFHDDGTVPYRHCMRCGGELEMRQLVPHDPPRHTCRECSFVYYLDPKVAAGMILSQDGGIILGRRSIEPGSGRWGLPSGYVDRGERVEDAAVREVREEVGLEAEIDRLVGVYSYSGRPVVVVVFAGHPVGGELVAGHETSEVRVFPHPEIPWDELAFSSVRESLTEFLRGADPQVVPPEK